MNREEEIEELKRLIEEEKQQEEEEKRQKRTRQSVNQRKYRNSRTPEQREQLLIKDRERNAKVRAAWTEEQKQKHLANVMRRSRANAERVNELAKKRRVIQQEQIAGRPRPATCDICNSSGIGNRPIMFDHCHNSNKFRGWLCFRCNAVLGQVQDNIMLLEKMIIYLRTNEHG